MAAAARVLVLGYNAWDVSCTVTEKSLLDQKHKVSAIRFGGGGPAATAAVALARLGARVKLITVLGSDLPAQGQEQELLAAGIDLGDVFRVAGADTPKAVILVDEKTGARTIFWSRGDLPTLDPNDVSLAWLDDQDLFYTDGHETAAALVLAREARRRRLPVVMDAGSVRPGSAELVASVSDAISSEKFAPELTGCDAPDEALRALSALGPERVAMTFGPGGALALVAEEVVHVPAFVVPVLDTTGAGDAFHAGYGFARTTGQGLVDCLEFGAAVAALKCTAWGGRAGLPELAAVRELIRTGVRQPVPLELAPFLG